LLLLLKDVKDLIVLPQFIISNPVAVGILSGSQENAQPFKVDITYKKAQLSDNWALTISINYCR
jgi:hypothetical protein